MANDKNVIIKIKRQLTPNGKSYWEEFSVPYRPNMNVISALMDIAADPVTRDGKATTPITYDSNCLEEVCGSCAMLINGKARMACSALIVPIDGSYDLGSGPRVSRQEQEAAYPLSRCISCCCCMEACPQFNEATGFVGAATISQVRLFNTHPTGAALKRERLAALMGDGGIQECGYAQNCVEVCPKDIPLTKSISEVGGQVMKQALADLLRR